MNQCVKKERLYNSLEMRFNSNLLHQTPFLTTFFFVWPTEVLQVLFFFSDIIIR